MKMAKAYAMLRFANRTGVVGLFRLDDRQGVSGKITCHMCHLASPQCISGVKDLAR